MDIQAINSLLIDNLIGVAGFFLVMGTFFLVLSIYACVQLSRMKKKYRKMMSGVEGGANLEKMLMSHVEETRAVVRENSRLDGENKRMDKLLQTAITRIGVVRYAAFEDMGSDLSYSVALLDAHNDGIILSSLFGRDVSRCYVKPIQAGKSTYKLTAEEEQSLQEAMKKE